MHDCKQISKYSLVTQGPEVENRPPGSEVDSEDRDMDDGSMEESAT
jgi:hypothetical protein